jgi:hypothetical protein
LRPGPGFASLPFTIIGIRRIIKTLNHLYANRARNRLEICTSNRTRVDEPIEQIEKRKRIATSHGKLNNTGNKGSEHFQDTRFRPFFR